MASTRLQEKYYQEVAPALKKEMGYKSIMQVARLEKICLNQGVGAAVNDKKLIETAVEELTTITGQKAVPTKAKKAISNFKLREGMPIGVTVTLRGKKMYEFLDRLITIALPRVRDFRGIAKKALMEEVITHWVSKNKSFFRKLV
jgi:large subunit ribosomal protein L5